MAKENHSDKIIKMSDEQICNKYIELSQLAYKQYHDRRELEWRIHIEIWTFLALIAYFCVSNEIKNIGNLAFGVFIFLLLHFFWIIKIWRGEILEQHLSICFRLKAEEILIQSRDSISATLPVNCTDYAKSKIPCWIEKIFKYRCWWLILELIPTIIICIGIIILIR